MKEIKNWAHRGHFRCIEIDWDMGDLSIYVDEWQDQGVYLDNWNKNNGTITLNGDEKDLMSWLKLVKQISLEKLN